MPGELDDKVARLKLKTLGLSIDKLTAEQKAYLASYQHGT
jgi:adenosylhomocysteinase